jgi:methyl-accepting chemotaxis protein
VRANDGDNVTTARETVAAVETAHVSFKTQIQEWKNIPLRGNERSNFDKYLAQFNREEERTQAPCRARAR